MTLAAVPNDLRRAGGAPVRRRAPRSLALVVWLGLGACDAARPAAVVVPEDALASWARRAPWCAPFLVDASGEVEEDLRAVDVAPEPSSTPYRSVTTIGPDLSQRIFGRAVRACGAAATATELGEWRRALRAATAVRGVALPPRPTDLRWALWRRGESVLLLMHDPTLRTLYLVGGFDRVVAVDLPPDFVTSSLFSERFLRR